MDSFVVVVVVVVVFFFWFFFVFLMREGEIKGERERESVCVCVWCWTKNSCVVRSFTFVLFRCAIFFFQKGFFDEFGDSVGLRVRL